jgi:hypothetical protein
MLEGYGRRSWNVRNGWKADRRMRLRNGGLLVLYQPMKKEAVLCATALLAAPLPALGHDFSCSNKAAEIRCEGGGCLVETASFTPMQLTRTGAVISLCAYSGCWEGRINFSRAQSDMHFLQGRIRRAESLREAESATISVMFSGRDQTAQINWNGFLSVLECGPPPKLTNLRTR